MIVQTVAGRVSGVDDNGITAFLGVPYAAPITTATQFREPQPVAPWAGVRAAERLGGVCPQLPTYGPVGRRAASALEHATDFLTVNVRTPDVTGSAPVLVWIHGGGYAVGSANEPQLQTGAFARSGIVEVTVNYRLGALGFARLPGFPDNRGLLDQIAALRWVRDNISAFGGDPERVTLSGRSAGGFAVATLLAMPASHGLYRTALAQSGASIAVLDIATADAVTARLAERAGVAVEQLAALPLDALIEAQTEVCDLSYERHDVDRDGSVTMLGVPFQPVIDGVSLPEHPEQAAAAGRTAAVPLVLGGTTAEYLTHSSFHSPEIGFDDVVRLVDPRVTPLGLSGTEIVSRYREALPDHSPLGIWRAVCGDLVFQNPTKRFAAAHGRHQPVHAYLYGEIGPDETGAAHGAEVGEVWHRDDGAEDGVPERFRVTDHDAARAVHAIWTSIVRDPLPSAPGTPWPRYTREDPVTLLVGRPIRTEADPFDARLALWEPEYSDSGIASGGPGRHPAQVRP